MATKKTLDAERWFEQNGWTPFPFQEATWQAVLSGGSGLVNAPTGSGKTYALLLGALMKEKLSGNTAQGLKLLWITPIRALAKEIKNSCERAIEGFGLDWTVAVRTGDTTSAQKVKQKNTPPEILITTPESIHVLFSQTGHTDFFAGMRYVVVDEWHELMGSKRGVLMELALAYFRMILGPFQLWGISANIGNMDDAVAILKGDGDIPFSVIRADLQKSIEVVSLIPKQMDNYPWSGHLGLRMAEQVLPIIKAGKTTLIFTNTRAQCEIWYQRLLELEPDLAGRMAIHHGSISRDIRDWVEDALYEGRLKAVVCTSSLDLGVDFRPVENIVQIGSPKGVARFIQRAGRSGHQPGATSRIYFVPTHSIELIEAAAFRAAVGNHQLEDRIPYIRCFDVLIQFLMTLAVSDGFYPHKIFPYIRSTFCYSFISEQEWQAVLAHLVYGAKSLAAYDEYHKVVIDRGRYVVTNKAIIKRHKMSIGVIVSDAMIQVKYNRGKKIGVVEEWFISQMVIGDVFWFAGRSLELIRLSEMTAYVRDSNKKTGRIPSYLGGRLQMSSPLSKVMREKLHQYHSGSQSADRELSALKPMLDIQHSLSMVPADDQFLIEYFETDEGFHLLMYPFEGRYVHEGMGALIAKRISKRLPISFSIAMNDYGFELLSDKRLDVKALITRELFSEKDLISDIEMSINAVEMARRKFRDIAVISGLIFQGYPGKQKKERHLQSSAQLLFGVFKEYEEDNILFRQTYEEVLTFQLEEARLRAALNRIHNQTFVIKYPERPTPFSFPIIVDGLREKMSSESLMDRIRKMTSG